MRKYSRLSRFRLLPFSPLMNPHHEPQTYLLEEHIVWVPQPRSARVEHQRHALRVLIVRAVKSLQGPGSLASSLACSPPFPRDHRLPALAFRPLKAHPSPRGTLDACRPARPHPIAAARLLTCLSSEVLSRMAAAPAPSPSPRSLSLEGL